MNTFDIAGHAIFKYPPYQRFVPWRCDADYELAVVSPVGIGPRGEKGEPLTWSKMTEQDKDDLIIRAVQGGLKGDKGDTGDTGASAYELAGGDAVWGNVDNWLESLQGRPGEWPDDPTERAAIMNQMASMFSQINLTTVLAYYNYIGALDPNNYHWENEGVSGDYLEFLPFYDLEWRDVMTGEVVEDGYEDRDPPAVTSLAVNGIQLCPFYQWHFTTDAHGHPGFRFNPVIRHPVEIVITGIDGYFYRR